MSDYNMDKSIEKEFNKLIKNWDKLDAEYKKRFKTYKTKAINRNRRNYSLGYWKKVDMLHQAGKIKIEII